MHTTTIIHFRGIFPINLAKLPISWWQKITDKILLTIQHQWTQIFIKTMQPLSRQGLPANGIFIKWETTTKIWVNLPWHCWKKRVLRIDSTCCVLTFISKQISQKSHVSGWQHGGCTWRIDCIPPLKYLRMILWFKP